MRIRGVLIAGALVGASLTGTGTGTAAPAARTHVLLAERVDPRADRVRINVQYSYDETGGRVGAAVLRRAGARWDLVDGVLYDGYHTVGPNVYRAGVVVGCGPGTTCDVTQESGIVDFNILTPRGRPQPDRIYLIVTGIAYEARFVDSPGWRMTRTRLATRFVTAHGGATATGAEVWGESVEHFVSATAPGGPRGSIAIGAPPCRIAHQVNNVREGYGRATLTGGRAPAYMDCPTSIHEVAAIADRATTWRLDGPVVGVGLGPTRLAVVDL